MTDSIANDNCRGGQSNRKQLSFSRLFLSYWKRRIATTTLQRENALFILNSSAHVLSATNRFDPECEPHLDEVLNHSLLVKYVIKPIFMYVSYN